jgi:hypothetical protein
MHVSKVFLCFIYFIVYSTYIVQIQKNSMIPSVILSCDYTFNVTWKKRFDSGNGHEFSNIMSVI